jgi:hypothetical protein
MKKRVSILFGIAAVLPLSVIHAAEYHMFSFVCSDSGGTSYSDWMDERITNTATFQRRWRLSCDSVTLKLKPLDGHAEIRPHSARQRMRLYREIADLNVNSNEPLRWRQASYLGYPNEVQFLSRDAFGERAYRWTNPGSDPDEHGWPDSFWFVIYNPLANNAFRVRITYRDQDNHEHTFYAIPWAELGY